MDDSETLAALKRAYADTILNTTKEAAARVLSSEKKTRMYQQEIVTVKDDAITTLLRLKKMYDSKVKETEEMSLKQQQKVEELEAQLGEAEDIVGELRMELRALHYELNKVANGQLSYLKDDHHQEASCPKTIDAAVSEVSSSQERSSGAVPVGSVVANGITNPSLSRLNSIKRCSSKDSMDRCHHTLPSILTKRTQKVDKKKSMANGDGEDPVVSQNTSQKDVSTPKEHEQSRKSVISATEERKEEKESCENNIEVLAEETPVLAAASKKRCIKYTFKRKRKKEALSSSTIEESRNIVQKTEEKEDGYLESLKPNSFTGESSRDSLCVVAQVARQLEPFSKQNGFAAEGAQVTSKS